MSKLRFCKRAPHLRSSAPAFFVELTFRNFKLYTTNLMQEFGPKIGKERCAVLEAINNGRELISALERLPQREPIKEINLAQATNDMIMHQNSSFRSDLEIETSTLWLSEPDDAGIIDSLDEVEQKGDFVRFVKGIDTHSMFKNTWMIEVKLPDGKFYFTPIGDVVSIR